MRNIPVSEVTRTIKEMCIEANHFLSSDMKDALCKANQQEKSDLGKIVLGQLMENLEIAGHDMIPICQDTSEMVWRLEMLADTENGIAYTQSDEQFYLVITISEETDESGSQKFINISNAGGAAPAGTYRLTLERLFEDQILSATEVQFFLCY